MIVFEKFQQRRWLHNHLLDYNYFKNYCKMIAVDLSKQQGFDTDTSK